MLIQQREKEPNLEKKTNPPKHKKKKNSLLIEKKGLWETTPKKGGSGEIPKRERS